MRRVSVVTLLTVGFALSGAAQNFPTPVSPLLAKPGDLCAFGGRVTSVDSAHRILAVSLGTKFLFHVPATTPIAFRQGAATDFDAIKAGQMVDIVARRELRDWTATKITLPRRGLHLVSNNPGGTFFGDEFSVTTTAGKVVTGLAAQRSVLYSPPEQLVNRGVDLGNHSGLFLLSIRPDGTVANVKVLQSMTVRELDERAIGRLSRVKFQPGAATEARVPIGSFSFRTR